MPTATTESYWEDASLPRDSLSRAAERLKSRGSLYLGGGVGVEVTKAGTYNVIGGKTHDGPLSAVTSALTLAGGKKLAGTPGGKTAISDPAVAARIFELDGEKAEVEATIQRMERALVRRQKREANTFLPTSSMAVDDSTWEQRRIDESKVRLKQIEDERSRLLSGKVQEAQGTPDAHGNLHSPKDGRFVAKVGSRVNVDGGLTRYEVTKVHPDGSVDLKGSTMGGQDYSSFTKSKIAQNRLAPKPFKPKAAPEPSTPAVAAPSGAVTVQYNGKTLDVRKAPQQTLFNILNAPLATGENKAKASAELARRQKPKLKEDAGVFWLVEAKLESNAAKKGDADYKAPVPKPGHGLPKEKKAKAPAKAGADANGALHGTGDQGGQFVSKQGAGSGAEEAQAAAVLLGNANKAGMAASIRAFQRKHGLQVDGVIGEQTSLALQGRYSTARRTKPGAMTDRTARSLRSRVPRTAPTRASTKRVPRPTSRGRGGVVVTESADPFWLS